MSIRFACGNCGQRLLADEQMKGLPVNCPACSQRVTTPEASVIPEDDQDIQFRCGKCTQSLVIDVAGAGLAVRCPMCGNDVTVPQREDAYMVPVPDWVEVSPSYLPTAALATRVYYKYWLEQIDRGRHPPLAGQIRYIFEYLYSAIDDFRGDGNIEHLLARFDRIGRGYPTIEEVRWKVRRWTSDAYLAVGDYDSAWAYRKPCRRVFELLAIRSKCRDTTIDGEDIAALAGGEHASLTPFAEARVPEIITRATHRLETLHHRCGKNFIDHFVHQFNFPDLTETDIDRLKQYFSNEKDFEFWRKLYFEEKELRRRRESEPYKAGTPFICLFENVPSKYSQSSVTLPVRVAVEPWWTRFAITEVEYFPSIIEVALLNELGRIFRECENELREEVGVPGVGEGWWSETELFYKLRQAFPEETVVHHGKPAWLAPQHLDVYFPKRNIACEYQGKQHQTPVEYFGGAEAFQEQQQRDSKKKRLCDEHGCLLLYVYEGYDFEKVKNEIVMTITNCGHRKPDIETSPSG